MYRQTFEGERFRTRADEGSGKQESVIGKQLNNIFKTKQRKRT